MTQLANLSTVKEMKWTRQQLIVGWVEQVRGLRDKLECRELMAATNINVHYYQYTRYNI